MTRRAFYVMNECFPGTTRSSSSSVQRAPWERVDQMLSSSGETAASRHCQTWFADLHVENAPSITFCYIAPAHPPHPPRFLPHDEPLAPASTQAARPPVSSTRSVFPYSSDPNQLI